MIQPLLLVHRTRPDAKLPTRGTDLAAGLDVYATIKDDKDAKLTVSRFGQHGAQVGDYYVTRDDVKYGVRIHPGSTVMIATGLKLGIPSGHAVLAFGRSGLGIKQGLRPGNAVGLVDEDYAGEIFIGLHNDSNEEQFVADGDRIAQLVCVPISLPPVVEANADQYARFMSIKNSSRGEGGFGSTGA